MIKKTNSEQLRLWQFQGVPIWDTTTNLKQAELTKLDKAIQGGTASATWVPARCTSIPVDVPVDVVREGYREAVNQETSKLKQDNEHLGQEVERLNHELCIRKLKGDMWKKAYERLMARRLDGGDGDDRYDKYVSLEL